MTEPALAPRNAFVGVFVVWGVALVAAVTVGLLAPAPTRMTWELIVFGALVLLSFAVQLWYGTVQGFIFRVGCSVLGALLLTGLISAGFGLVGLIPSGAG